MVTGGTNPPPSGYLEGWVNEDTIREYINIYGYRVPDPSVITGDIPIPQRNQAEGSLSIDELFTLMFDTIKIVKPDIIFCPAYPDYVTTRLSGVEGSPTPTFVDTITYKIVRREPGSLDRHFFDNRKEIKPRIRDEYPHPTNEGEIIQMYGQWFDNLVQFDCWCKTNKEAVALIKWFEDFMYQYTGLFMKYGLQQMIYWERIIDDTITSWKSSIAVRSVRYGIRTEKLVPVYSGMIKEIGIRLLDMQTPSELNT